MISAILSTSMRLVLYMLSATSNVAERGGDLAFLHARLTSASSCENGLLSVLFFCQLIWILHSFLQPGVLKEKYKYNLQYCKCFRTHHNQNYRGWPRVWRTVWTICLLALSSSLQTGTIIRNRFRYSVRSNHQVNPSSLFVLTRKCNRKGHLSSQIRQNFCYGNGCILTIQS